MRLIHFSLATYPKERLLFGLKNDSSLGLEQIYQRNHLSNKNGHRLTFQFHADVHTLLEPAVGTPFPLCLVDDAAALCHTGVDLFVLHGALEEPLAGFASQ